MGLFTHGADNRIVDVGILRYIIGGEALNAMSRLWTTI
jgi:hypothetical protein